jgi:glucose/arabinose dehydrogenase
MIQNLFSGAEWTGRGKMKYFRLTAILLTFYSLAVTAYPIPLELIKLPPGFKIEIYAQNLKNAREMSFSPSGTLFIGSNAAGNVYAVSGKTDKKTYIIARGLKMPVGVAFHNGSLYVSAVNKILRYDNVDARLDNPPAPVVVSASFPSDMWHGWKFIRFGPDGKLYVPVGAPCNECIPPEPVYATITRLDLKNEKPEIYSQGIRNTVGFDWDPLTGDLWFTDNGRDYLGDDVPPDELDHAPVKGMNFGYPFIHGNNIVDPDIGKKIPPNFKFTKPEVELGPHVAALGMRFYTANMFPPEYRDQIFIAEHGSWNRSVPIGYRISLVKLNRKTRRPEGYEIFASGWLQSSGAWGRPADVEVGPDGALYVSDDHAGIIYRISYGAEWQKK